MLCVKQADNIYKCFRGVSPPKQKKKATRLVFPSRETWLLITFRDSAHHCLFKPTMNDVLRQVSGAIGAFEHARKRVEGKSRRKESCGLPGDKGIGANMTRQLYSSGKHTDYVISSSAHWQRAWRT